MRRLRQVYTFLSCMYLGACASQVMELPSPSTLLTISSISGDKRYLVEIEPGPGHTRFLEILSSQDEPQAKPSISSDDARPSIQEHLRQIREHSRNENYSTALDLVRQLIAEHPEHGRLYQLKGGLYLRSGMLHQAREALEFAASLEPENQSVRQGLAKLELRLAADGSEKQIADRPLQN